MTNIETLGREIARRGNRFQYTYCSAWGFSKPDSWGRVLRTDEYSIPNPNPDRIRR